MEPTFVYVSCQPGAEKALKAEWEILSQGRATFSFSRPGFVTFRMWEGWKPVALESVWARTQGISYGKAQGNSQEGSFPDVIQRIKDWPTPVQVQLWYRDRWIPGDEPPKSDSDQWPEPFLDVMKLGDPTAKQILDVVVVDPGQVMWGIRLPRLRGDLGTPGEKWMGTLAEGAPSRAYLKLQEGLARNRFPMKPGEWVVELGSSPGGACLALLEKGVNVIGVDTAAMDPILSQKFKGRFFHIPTTAQKTFPDQFPKDFRQIRILGGGLDWLFADMHIDAQDSLELVGQWVFEHQAALKGAVLTLKLKSWDQAALVPRWVERFKSFGFSKILARQLSTNRQEIHLSGLTKKGALLL
ncbi:MAG: hypothetical protein JNL01_02020 [Bdellovibrionales bacterium]|nr:hypothetical protein [Bdellovibrionales bacterium]